jgi:hypothetical protein
VETPVRPLRFAGNRNHTEEAKPPTSPHQKLYQHIIQNGSEKRKKEKRIQLLGTN